nr:MAG TPA: hypothetical protein [Caudoviricetes sp.]DAM37907.1 MAG TPA: hypothetical protein [Caudoviricetes sp.]DAS07075.1 MAG TPA: hypothetical protein [Caudoviricetes sp.]DAV33555.1 MAG TPA: hypothetical protein [Caudoviricetes sp.]
MDGLTALILLVIVQRMCLVILMFALGYLLYIGGKHD